MIVSLLGIFFMSCYFSAEILSIRILLIYLAIVTFYSIVIYFVLKKIRFIYKFRALGGSLAACSYLFFQYYKVTNSYVLLFVLAFFVSNLFLVLRMKDDFFE